MRVTFVHLDLGIGGAERLVVDAGVALQKTGNYKVDFVTSHHDTSHCFPETKQQLEVAGVGDWLPRSVFGKFYVLCSILRMIYLSLFIFFTRRNGPMKPDIIFVDQVSQCIPFLRLLGVPVLFYCHHPDCLLVRQKSSLRDIYRFPIDWFEEYCTSLADMVVANSEYTVQIFRSTFKKLNYIPVEVLYPTVNCSLFDQPVSESELKDISCFDRSSSSSSAKIFLSLNRYERKKAIGLSIEAIALVLERFNNDREIHLIVAGGYDNAVSENVEHFEELKQKSVSLGVKDSVTFLKSPSDKCKQALISKCSAVVYTPVNEHFGIVPIEAMYAQRPVIATNTGGPLETVQDGVTGFLCEPSAECFADAMEKIIRGGSDFVESLGNAGKKRVEKMFSSRAFQSQLCKLMDEIQGGKKRRN